MASVISHRGGLSAAEISQILSLQRSVRRIFLPWERKTWSLQFASNLHAYKDWNKAWGQLVPGAGESLVLLGNCISCGSDEANNNTYEFLQRCSSTWDRVFVIPGATEFADWSEDPADFWELQDRIQAIASAAHTHGDRGNIQIMTQAEHEFFGKDIVLLGTSLWSDCHEMHAFPKEHASMEKNIWVTDLKGQRRLRPSDMRSWASEDMAWLAKRIQWWKNQRPGIRIVVGTYTLPTGHLLQRGMPDAVYARARMDIPTFEALEDVFRAGPITAWLGGATGSCVSGMCRSRTFCATNGLYMAGGSGGGGDTALANPNYLPNRCLTLNHWDREIAATVAPARSEVSPLSPQLR